MTTDLHEILDAHVSKGPVPGAVGLLVKGDRTEVQAAGSADVEGTAPMARDSIFRIASMTKPIVAAAVMMLVEEGPVARGETRGRWLAGRASP
ncbi:serine hydrolase, partial [Streptomyces sp. NPDC059744]|uniref:serine hydrolase n=1 Tax=Streptomyces sp. NPDC059744 TaxID=3346929 RepID=UPI00365CA03D